VEVKASVNHLFGTNDERGEVRLKWPCKERTRNDQASGTFVRVHREGRKDSLEEGKGSRYKSAKKG